MINAAKRQTAKEIGPTSTKPVGRFAGSSCFPCATSIAPITNPIKKATGSGRIRKTPAIQAGAPLTIFFADRLNLPVARTTIPRTREINCAMRQSMDDLPPSFRQRNRFQNELCSNIRT
jgi:hypothetical protein